MFLGGNARKNVYIAGKSSSLIKGKASGANMSSAVATTTTTGHINRNTKQTDKSITCESVPLSLNNQTETENMMLSVTHLALNCLSFQRI